MQRGGRGCSTAGCGWEMLALGSAHPSCLLTTHFLGSAQAVAPQVLPSPAQPCEFSLWSLQTLPRNQQSVGLGSGSLFPALPCSARANAPARPRLITGIGEEKRVRPSPSIPLWMCPSCSAQPLHSSPATFWAPSRGGSWHGGAGISSSCLVQAQKAWLTFLICYFISLLLLYLHLFGIPAKLWPAGPLAFVGN